MSTFHPAASSLANFNDTLSTISTIRLIYISCSRQDKNQCLSWHHRSRSLRTVHGELQVNTENLHQGVETQCSGGSKISTFHPVPSSLANYNGTISTISTTRLFCRVHVYQKDVVVLGVWSIFSLHY